MSSKENILKVMNDIYMDVNFIAFRSKTSLENTVIALNELLKSDDVVEHNGSWRKKLSSTSQ
jgi:hypothetical protein